MSKLFPDLHVPSVWEIDFDKLYADGIRGIILDIDNTLAPYFVPDPDKKIEDGIQKLQEKSFSLFIVSNGREERVIRFNRSLNLPYYCKASKPTAKGFKVAQQHMGLKPEQIAVIGDQIFTDVWGGNRLNMKTVLVKQVSPKDEWITKVKRPLEKIVMFFYRRKKRV